MSARAARRAYSDAYETGRVFTLVVRTQRGEPSIIINAYDGNRCASNGGFTIDVEVRQDGKVIFPRGALYCSVSPGHTIDGVHAKELVISTVAMRPGDTDLEYFLGYTPEQLTWATKHGDALGAERECRYCCHECGAVRPCSSHGGRKGR